MEKKYSIGKIAIAVLVLLMASFFTFILFFMIALNGAIHYIPLLFTVVVRDLNEASNVETLVDNALRSDIRANLVFILDQSVSSPVLLSTCIIM